MAVLVALVYHHCVMFGFAIFLVVSWSDIRQYAALIVVGVFLTGGARAQSLLDDSINPFKIGVNSPTAASIGEAALSEIALETGAVQVNIPLFEITSRSGLSVPVTLSYQSNGVKMNDAGGWVGFGWTLHAGGAVTRTVRGTPDEWTPILPHNYGGGYPYVRHRYNNMNQWDHIPHQILLEMVHYRLDTQPDLFVYANPHHSGSFIWYGVDTFVTVPRVPLNIARLPNTGWEINDVNGITYKYEVVEITAEITPSAPPDLVYPSAWYLTSMSHEGGQIQFGYNTFSTLFGMMSSFSREWIEASGVADVCTQINQGSDQLMFTASEIQERHLETIQSEDMRAVFHSSRASLPLDQWSSDPGEFHQRVIKLDSIQVFSLPGNVLIRSFHFDYTNYPSQANGYLGRHTNRHFLTSVTEIGQDGEALPPYLFNYIDPTQLPGRLTENHQNAWGYASVTGTNPQTRDNGLLERVDYPTGAWEEIEYEYNRVPELGGPGGGLVSAPGDSQTASAEYPNGLTIDQRTFTVNAGEGPWTVLEIDYELWADAQGALVSHYVEISCPDVYESGRIQYTIPGGILTGTLSIPLDDEVECTITASVETGMSPPLPQRAEITATWREWITPLPGHVYGEIAGGLRVKQQRAYPDQNSDPLIREYHYVDAGGSSSGIGREGSFEIPLFGTCIGRIRTVSAVSTVGSTIDVTYRRVEVHEGGFGVTGKTVHTFYQIENQPDGGTAGVFIPGSLTNLDWQNHPTGQTVYNDQNEIVQSSTSSYTPTSPGQPYHTTAPAFTARVFPWSMGYYVPYFTRYTVISGWNRLVATQEIHHDVD